MDNINTLLGLGLGNQDNMNALANKLRGEQKLGQMLGMSTIDNVAQHGQRIQDNTTQAANRGGVLNRAMEAENTRKEEREEDYQRGLGAEKRQQAHALKLATAKKKADSLKYGDFKPYVDADGNIKYLTRKGGEVFELDESGDIRKSTMEGLSPYEKPTKGSEEKAPKYGDFKPYVDAEGNIRYFTRKGGEILELDESGEIKKSTLDGLTPFKAESKGSRGGGGIYTQFGSPKQQKEFEDLATETENQITVFGQFKPEYASDSVLPLVGTFENFLSRELPNTASPEMIEQQRWWRDYKKQYENIARHKLFGSALTEAEIKAWKAANVSPDSNAEQIKDAMGTLRYLAIKLANRAKDNATTKNRDPEYISNNYGFLDNYSKFTDLSVVPEGVNRDEWEELTYNQRQEILDLGIQ